MMGTNQSLPDCNRQDARPRRPTLPARNRQDSILPLPTQPQPHKNADGTVPHRPRLSSRDSEATSWLNSLVSQTLDEPASQPFLPPRPQQDYSAGGRRRSLPGARREPRVVYAPPYADVFEQEERDGDGNRDGVAEGECVHREYARVDGMMYAADQTTVAHHHRHRLGQRRTYGLKRLFTTYPRCCNSTYMTGIYFALLPPPSSSHSNSYTTTTSSTTTPASDYLSAFSSSSPMTPDALSTVISQADDEAICPRCLDRLRWRVWRLGMKLGTRVPLYSSAPKGGFMVGFEANRVAAEKAKAAASLDSAGDEDTRMGGADSSGSEYSVDEGEGGDGVQLDEWIDEAMLDGDTECEEEEEGDRDVDVEMGRTTAEAEVEHEEGDRVAMEAARCLLSMR